MRFSATPGPEGSVTAIADRVNAPQPGLPPTRRQSLSTPVRRHTVRLRRRPAGRVKRHRLGDVATLRPLLRRSGESGYRRQGCEPHALAATSGLQPCRLYGSWTILLVRCSCTEYPADEGIWCCRIACPAGRISGDRSVTVLRDEVSIIAEPPQCPADKIRVPLGEYAPWHVGCRSRGSLFLQGPQPLLMVPLFSLHRLQRPCPIRRRR